MASFCLLVLLNFLLFDPERLRSLRLLALVLAWERRRVAEGLERGTILMEEVVILESFLEVMLVRVWKGSMRMRMGMGMRGMEWAMKVVGREREMR